VNKPMLRDSFFIARMDLGRLLRIRETLFWTFVMPVVFVYFFGTISAQFWGSPENQDELAVLTAADAGFLAEQLTGRLEASGYRVIRKPDPLKFQNYARRLTIPAGFTKSILAGQSMKLAFTHSGSDLSGEYDRVRLTRAVSAVIGDLMVARKNGAVVGTQSFARQNAEQRVLSLDVRSAGHVAEPPTGFNQSVPGTMVMFTLLVLFTVGGVTLMVERRRGLLRRLASAPMSRGEIVLGKWGARMALGMIQIAFAMVTGTLLFHVRWGPHLAMVCLVLFAYAALVVALGMLLGNFCRSEGQIIGFGVIASNVLAGLGGCWWPAEITPLWAQKVALALPTGWTMDALHKLINFGAPPAAVIPHFCALTAASVLVGYVVARSFHFD
jgi:ABC-2 type transport system permease protein